jgi:glycine/D-amino acid oxidase-like deaminating enzyme
MKIVICGAGVIGAAIAYALSQRGLQATIIEASAPACAASGKSGGFLALDWCDGSAMSQLARRSFDLHTTLGQQFGEQTGYRRVDTLSIIATEAPHDLSAYAKIAAPPWLNGRCAVNSQLGNADTTAQVHPELFTTTLLNQALAKGCELIHGRVNGIVRDANKVRGVMLDDATFDADVVVIALGPWSALACDWLPVPKVMGQKGASIVLQAQTPIAAHAVFGQYINAAGVEFGPEIFPRPDGQVYMCGVAEHAPLPIDGASVEPSDDAIATLLAIAKTVSRELAEATLLRAQACYRPIVADALPLMGAVPDVAGAYIASAHNCWGILNAPASGEAMAELIVTGATTHVDLRPFSVARPL